MHTLRQIVQLVELIAGKAGKDIRCAERRVRRIIGGKMAIDGQNLRLGRLNDSE